MYKDSQKQFKKESSEVGLALPEKNNSDIVTGLDKWNRIGTSKNRQTSVCVGIQQPVMVLFITNCVVLCKST